jgi:hypothetical protein
MTRIIPQSNRFDLFNGYGQAFAWGFCGCLFVIFLDGYYPTTGILGFANPFATGAVMGALVFAVGVLNTARQRRFGRPYLQLDTAAASTSINLSFGLPVLKRTTPEYIGMFLVYRECVTFPTSDETNKNFDRLMASFESTPEPIESHKTLEIKCCFRLPTLSGALLNPYSKAGKREVSVTGYWLVKVKICVTGQEDLWYEFTLSSADLPHSSTLPDAEAPQKYRVVLESASGLNPVTNTGMQELLVHLRRDQVYDLMHAAPAVLRERLSLQEAEEIRGFIESVGACASVVEG